MVCSSTLLFRHLYNLNLHLARRSVGGGGGDEGCVYGGRGDGRVCFRILEEEKFVGVMKNELQGVDEGSV